MKKLPVVLLFTALIVVGFGYIIVRTGDSATEIAESLATIETARAMQDAAEAAEIASRGLSTVSTIQAAILFLIVVAVLALAGTIVYLLLDRSARNAQLVALLDGQQRRQWVSGPNAGWKKLGDSQSSTQAHQPQVSMQDAVAMAAVGLMAGVMRQLQNPYPQQPTYPLNQAPQQGPFAETGEADATYMQDYFGVPAKQLPPRSDWDMFNE